MAKKRKKSKIKRFIRRYRRILFLIGLLLLLILCVTVIILCVRRGRAKKNTVPEENQTPAIVEADLAVEPEAPIAAAAEIQEEDNKAVPAMPEPTIQEEWYIERNNRLFKYMKLYGGYSSDAEIYARIQQLQLHKTDKMVAFTFDDGPYSPYTEKVLDVLEKYGVRATFFVKGAYVALDENRKQLERELGLGCELGNHTMNHDDLEKMTKEEMIATVEGVNRLLLEKFDYVPVLLRPPYISYGEKGSDERKRIVDMCKEKGLSIVNHTRSSHDTYQEYTPEMICERMTAETDELGRGITNSIFLFHDKYQKTVEAIDMIIPILLEKGYTFVTISELLQCSKEGLHPGWIYSKAD